MQSGNTKLKNTKSLMDINKTKRVSLLRTAGCQFIFVSLGVDEGWTVEDKIELEVLGSEFIRESDIERDIGVLSGGRLGNR